MSSSTGGGVDHDQLAREAVSDLEETHAAYVMVQELLAAPQPQEMLIDRSRLSSLLTMLNVNLGSQVRRAREGLRGMHLGRAP